MAIQKIYTTFPVVMRMRTAGRPRTPPSNTIGIASGNVFGGDRATVAMRRYVRAIATGRTTVPRRSINTTNCMLKQKVPQ